MNQSPEAANPAWRTNLCLGTGLPGYHFRGDGDGAIAPVAIIDMVMMMHRNKCDCKFETA